MSYSRLGKWDEIVRMVTLSVKERNMLVETNLQAVTK